VLGATCVARGWAALQDRAPPDPAARGDDDPALLGVAYVSTPFLDPLKRARAQLAMGRLHGPLAAHSNSEAARSVRQSRRPRTRGSLRRTFYILLHWPGGHPCSPHRVATRSTAPACRCLPQVIAAGSRAGHRDRDFTLRGDRRGLFVETPGHGGRYRRDRELGDTSTAISRSDAPAVPGSRRASDTPDVSRPRPIDSGANLLCPSHSRAMSRRFGSTPSVIKTFPPNSSTRGRNPGSPCAYDVRRPRAPTPLSTLPAKRIAMSIKGCRGG